MALLFISVSVTPTLLKLPERYLQLLRDQMKKSGLN